MYYKLCSFNVLARSFNVIIDLLIRNSYKCENLQTMPTKGILELFYCWITGCDIIAYAGA